MTLQIHQGRLVEKIDRMQIDREYLEDGGAESLFMRLRSICIFDKLLKRLSINRNFDEFVYFGRITTTLVVEQVAGQI